LWNVKINRKQGARMRGNLLKVAGLAEGAAPKVDRRRAPETAARILDSAEALFAQRGFYGVSLRDIAAAAGVQLALSHYHFGSKENLFSAVIERRAGEHAGSIAVALAGALAVEGSRQVRREAIVRALIGPIAERLLHGGAGWKNYIRLLALVANHPQEEDYVSPFRQHYDSLIRAFVKALAAIHPEIALLDVQWGFFFYQAAITHILVESGMLERQSDGALRSGDFAAMVERIVPFFSAGFLGLGARD
jgi:AcrR family transcriptional regulator